MVKRTGRAIDERIYGAAAAVLGCFLFWYALWTLICNILVLSEAHFPALEWGLAATTFVSALVAWRFGGRIVDLYSWRGTSAAGSAAVPADGDSARSWRSILFIGAAALPALVAADLGNRVFTSIPYVAACAAAFAILWSARRRGAFADLAPVPLAIGWRLPALVALLLIVYYFSHLIDGDDANFVNLAAGAQRTAYGVFQVDTMLGDGPHLIHLPTYKFHSFELLGAVISSWLGMSPIVVFHLILPAIQIPILAAVLLLVLGGAVGRFWFAAALFWLAFLFLNEVSIGGWGLHGLIRFYQGKGFLVSVLLPLIAALTARWLKRGERLDLFGLLLANICAVGFSANGIYGGPAASGLVAAAFLATHIRAAVIWQRVALLLPTFAWPLTCMALIVALKLALPSEVMQPTTAIDQLNLVVWYGIAGRLTLAALAVSAVGLLQTSIAIEALIYIPLAMALTLNPASWALISAASGNLGFRIFWSMPVAFMLSLAAISALRLTGARSERTLTGAGFAAMLGSIAFLGTNHNPVTTVRWHSPDLKVIRPDYELARRLAAQTDPRCSILAPETYSMLISMIAGAPHPVFVRTLYLIHYRFTMPPAERVLRNQLRRVVDGPANVAVPTPEQLRSLFVPVGTVAVRADAPSRGAAAALAHELALTGPTSEGPLLIWSGPCHR